MSKSQQVKFGFVVDRSNPQEPVTLLKTIQLADGQRGTVGPIFAFAEGDGNMKKHQALMNLQGLQSALKGIANERNPFITLKQPVLDEYLDGDLNPKFNEQLLDELTETLPEHNILNGSMSFSSQTEQLLAQQVASLTRQLELRNKRKDLNDLIKKFSLQSFNGEGDEKMFRRTFEDECQKHDVIQSNERVDALRSFCKDTALTWWGASRVKLNVENWAAWRTAFLLIFGPKTFREVRMAYGYMYKFGSFHDYAIEKEQRLLELDGTLTEMAIIDSIVIGLPLYVQDELKRDELKTVNQLLVQLTQMSPKPNNNSASRNSTKSGSWRDDPRREIKKSEKEPCQLCTLLGHNDRYHPVDRCRNKAKAEELIKSAKMKKFNINLHEAEKSCESEDSRTSSSSESEAERSSKSSGSLRLNRTTPATKSGNE